MLIRVPIFSLLLLGVSLIAYSQNPATLTGRYQGTVDIEGLGKLPVSADIRESGGKVTGAFRTPFGDSEIISGSYASGALSIVIDAGGDDITLDGKLSGAGSISGSVGGLLSGNPAKGSFELRRVGDLAPKADLAPILYQSKDKWREDLRYLATELPKRHKDAFNRISKPQWDSLVAELDARVSRMSDEEILLGLDRIASSIGDGHTGLVWTGLFPRVPVRYFWFGKELRITQSASEYPQLAGARVVRMNGMDVGKIYEAGRPYIAQHESEEYVLDTSAFLMTYPAFLKTVGAGKRLDTVRIDYMGKDGRKGSASLTPVKADAKIEWLHAYTTAPLYLQHPDKALYLEYLKDAKTVYVNFKRYPRRAEFKKFSDELFALVDTNDVAKVVFDFRLNGGGDFTRGRDHFVKPLKERKKFLERGRLFVITGRRTFSAGMSNAADFRNDLNAVLVGEPTGARPNGYQENRSFALPNSRLTVSYSIEFYKFSETDTPGLIPDKFIPPTWEAYAAGRDPALEWILEQR